MNKTLIADLESIKGVSFFNATGLKKDWHISSTTAKTITSQPGYRRGKEMCVTTTVKGGWRLYTRVDGKWMDGSLSDIA